jgi:hypothetical protein
VQAREYGAEVPGKEQQGDGPERDKKAAIWCLVSLS